MAAVLGSATVYLDSTIVNVALERIGEQLPSHLFGKLEGQSYVYNGYLLSLCALIILAGALTDYYGRRRMFVIGLAGFGLTSALCGLAPNLELLVVFRIVQGAAGALLVPGSIALINTHFNEAERPRAYGIWAAASSATTTLGSPIGGILVDTLSWRAAFLINLPITALALGLTLAHVTETRDEQATGHFDWLGAGVIALGIGGLAFGGIRGQESNWQAASAFVALGIGVAACAAFVPLMRRSRNPLVPLDLFRSRNFTVVNLSTLVIYGALYVSFYVQALFYQGVLGYSALAAGLASLPSGVMIATLSTAVGSLAARFGLRRFLVLGPSLMGCGLLWLSRIPAGSAAWTARVEDPASLLPPASYLIDVLPAALAFGGGAALLVAPLTSVLMSSVPDERSGLASAINNAISRIGPQLAGALVFIAVTASFYSALARELPSVDTTSAAIRSVAAPLNRPDAGASLAVAHASKQASTAAFSLATRLATVLLFSGAAINGFGMQRAAPGAKALSA
ncbi:MAG TPA: MFS transporter [Chloroflexota bacterium]|nr:MFS transporter [Chloroflexota bacterium]